MLAVHVEQSLAAGAFVEVIDILGNEEQGARPFGIEPSERGMGGVGLFGLDGGAAHVVEAQDKIGVTSKCLRGGNVLDAVFFP